MVTTQLDAKYAINNIHIGSEVIMFLYELLIV